MDMEVGELWEMLNERINWYWSGLGGLLFANVIMFLLLVWNFLGTGDFFQRHRLQPTALIVTKQKKLEKIPKMEEIEITDKSLSKPFPERYADLQKSDLFIPPSERESKNIAMKTNKKDKKQPPIRGFSMVGRIYGQGNQKLTVLRKKSSGKTYVAREGEFLQNTDIKVEKITDRLVRLNQPGRRATEFRFKTDEIAKKVQKFVDFH